MNHDRIDERGFRSRERKAGKAMKFFAWYRLYHSSTTLLYPSSNWKHWRTSPFFWPAHSAVHLCNSMHLTLTLTLTQLCRLHQPISLASASPVFSTSSFRCMVQPHHVPSWYHLHMPCTLETLPMDKTCVGSWRGCFQRLVFLSASGTSHQWLETMPSH